MHSDLQQQKFGLELSSSRNRRDYGIGIGMPKE